MSIWNKRQPPRYNVYNIRMNRNTHHFGGAEWVVDGELGYVFYPGDWTKEQARDFYERGLYFDGLPIM